MATKHDWKRIDPLIDRLISEGFSQEDACKEVGVNWGTYRKYRKRLRDAGHPGTPESTDTTEVHLSTPETTESSKAHQGTLEGHQEVMEDVHQSVPDAPHIGTEEMYQDTPELPSTPEVHQELSASDSGVPMEHSSVPARQAYSISTPMVHPGTPTAEDWDLWMTIKARWREIEKMLSDRQALLSTPRGTPGHTQKKTYVFDVRHIALIEQYAEQNRLDLKDVIYTMCEEFFQRRS